MLFRSEIIEFPATGTGENYPWTFNAGALPATSQISGPNFNVFLNDGPTANIETNQTFDSNGTTQLYFRITQGAKLAFGMLLHNNYSRLTDIRTASLGIFSNEQYIFSQGLGGSTIEIWKKGVLDQTVAGIFSVGNTYRVSITSNTITLALNVAGVYFSVGSPMTIDTPSATCVAVVGDYGTNAPNGDYYDEAVVGIYEPAVLGNPAVKLEKVGNDFQIGTNLSIDQLTNVVKINSELQLANTTASQLVETDSSNNLVSVAKGTAFNKAFGSVNGTVAHGDVVSSEKGNANGLCPLNASGKVDGSYLTAIAVTSVTVVANIAARDALTPAVGDVCKVIDSVADTGFVKPQTYIYDDTIWVDIQETSDVVTVAGKTGTVVLNSSDVGLGNVLNKNSLSVDGSNIFTGAQLQINNVNPSISIRNGGGEQGVISAPVGLDTLRISKDRKSVV